MEVETTGGARHYVFIAVAPRPYIGHSGWQCAASGHSPQTCRNCRRWNTRQL